MRRNLLLLAALAAAAPAQAKTEVSPYIEVGQVLTTDFEGDVLTYTTVAAGIDAAVTTKRVEAQLSYRYEHRIDYEDEIGDDSIHSGLARGRIRITPDLSFDAGALATRARTDARGPAPELLVGDVENVSQVYSAYAGPALATRVGAVDVTAAYRLGYTKVEESTRIDLPAGQQRLDAYDDATGHLATASVGVRPGPLPIGVRVSAAYEREDNGQLDGRYEGKYVRGDVTVPVSPTVAVVGGVGYEDIEISQRDALRDAGGAPVVDEQGRFVTAPSSPRRLAYDIDGIIWDAGVLWKPSRRTRLEARAGRRYGGTTYFGAFTHQLSPGSGVSVAVYDSVESFGRLLNDNVARLPTSFNVARNPLNDPFNGCVFAAQGQGGCFNDAFQSIYNANFRSRGATALYSAGRGPISFGVAGGYNRRRYFAPLIGAGAELDGVVDEVWYAELSGGYQLSDKGQLTAAVNFNYFDSGLAGAPEVVSTGATGAYNHAFSRNFSAVAALGFYGYDIEGGEDEVSGSALVGAQIRF